MAIAERIFARVAGARYVATYIDGALTMESRPDLLNASSSESDRYEELIVNPTLLTLTKQRGDIDCGGLRWMLVRYGAFFQFIHPVPGGHVSVALEPSVNLEASIAMLVELFGA